MARETTDQTMVRTMQQMLANEGYVVKVGITPGGYVATCAIDNAEMQLTYGLHLTPGDVVWNVRAVLHTLNRKQCKVCGENILPAAGRSWKHEHSNDTYCGTGDGAVAEPKGA
jgi:hypothetical protein